MDSCNKWLFFILPEKRGTERSCEPVWRGDEFRRGQKNPGQRILTGMDFIYFFLEWSRSFSIPKPKVMPMRTMKISRRPRNIPNISTIKVAVLVVGPVRPMDRPTVPREEEKSNMASVRLQSAVAVISREPRTKITR